jgi:hypothetical protein
MSEKLLKLPNSRFHDNPFGGSRVFYAHTRGDRATFNRRPGGLRTHLEFQTLTYL